MFSPKIQDDFVTIVIFYAETEIKNIEIILQLHAEYLTNEEIDTYLDKINIAKKRIKDLKKQLKKNR